ncbi:MAG: selenoneine biosynthesis selenosugar synthase SenB [Burkholderiaceae bacterium]
MRKPTALIVSPALAEANNGNWQTAKRWSHLLAPHCAVRIVQHWQGENADVMLALHARRSADSVARWAQTHPGRGLAVVLTGTDLYGDLLHDTAALASLQAAQQVVVLQERGPQALQDVLGGALRDKVRVIFQSTTLRQTLPKTQALLRAVMVGHLREEKSPQTLFAAARLLRGQQDIRIDHIGAALNEALGQQAQQTQTDCPHYRWLGGLPHAAARQRIQRAHVLVHASRIEGGAHVIMEAVCSGTPVLASRIAGNVGMLGADYAGYFEHGNAQALADVLLRCRAAQARMPVQARPAADNLLLQISQQCAARAVLFDPFAEQAALLALLQELTA